MTALTRMDCFDVQAEGDFNNTLAVEIRADSIHRRAYVHRTSGGVDMRSGGVRIGVNGNGFNVLSGKSLLDPARNFPSVGDEDALDAGRRRRAEHVEGTMKMRGNKTGNWSLRLPQLRIDAKMGRAQAGWQDGSSLQPGAGGAIRKLTMDENAFAAALRELGASSPAAEKAAITTGKLDKEDVGVIAREFNLSPKESENALHAAGGSLTATIARLTLV